MTIYLLTYLLTMILVSHVSVKWRPATVLGHDFITVYQCHCLCRVYYELHRWFDHFLPAWMMDLCLSVVGKKPVWVVHFITVEFIIRVFVAA